jgi:hypothetical protein
MCTDKDSYVWKTVDGKTWEALAVYESESIAIRQIRVAVDNDPDLVEIDLTIYPVDPPAEERAAAKILDRYGFKDDGSLAAIIGRETNIAEITEHVQALLAYIFSRRRAFAAALFPIVDGKEPRDLVLDGILLSAIEAMAKSTKQDYGNLLAILRKPVSAIVTPNNHPMEERPN